MNVVVLADSQGLPRAKGWGNIPFEATYPYLLGQLLRDRLGDSAPFVIDRSSRGRTMKHVMRDWEEEVELKNARVIVLHVGGSDCAPRVFLPSEQEIIQKIPVKRVRQALLRLEKRHKRRILSWMPQRVCVPLAKFEARVADVVERVTRDADRCLIFVNIMAPTEHVSFHLPGLMENIASYNQVLARYCDSRRVHLVQLDRLVDDRGGAEKWTVDGVHLNGAGHLLLARELEACVMRFVASRFARKEGP